MSTLPAGTAVHLPGELPASARTGARIAAASDGSAPPSDMIERATAVTEGHPVPGDPARRISTGVVVVTP
ncbi:hypothetical protein Acsp06_64460 [Actinomycetospora sp. NBRC 106375]|uniref:hypothetical protein n=1 Tax=Actinomycetospora sp. NBRC 106375 TaxID=3032207 RepID=UPI0024A24199|nr:hypothetical protein [Actinomycetospora sp. NBRC 106375]GLZ50261.1 hypothetical protein Acsp06_64460 [Actinomycetospora sp. NBRC 106375]